MKNRLRPAPVGSVEVVHVAPLYAPDQERIILMVVAPKEVGSVVGVNRVQRRQQISRTNRAESLQDRKSLTRSEYVLMKSSCFRSRIVS